MRKSIAILLAVLMLFTLFQGALRENVARADTKLGLEYIIVVANPSLKDTVQDFVKFKESQGFDVIVEDIPTIEQNYQGVDRAEKIRNFLKDKTKDYPKSFTLLIGKAYNKEKVTDISTGGDIPMRIISSVFINYYSRLPESYSYPTDFYYADLEGDWDKNNNGKYGEIQFDETTQKGEKIDEVNEQVHNFVGRIPFSENEVVKTILANTINLQQSEFKNKALLAMIKSEARKSSDLAEEGEKLITEILKPVNFNVTTLYEKEGNNPSLYNCTASLNNENFITYFPDNDLVITAGENGILREVWYDYNSDGQIQEDVYIDKSEVKYPPILSLDGLKFLTSQGVKTKIFFEWGCESWNYKENPVEDWYVSADDILRSGISAAVVGTTKIIGEADIAHLESFCNTVITAHLPIGEWLYNDKYPRKPLIPSEFWWSLLDYNILGDPSFSLFNDSLLKSVDDVSPALQILSPLDGTITNKTEINISGTATDIGLGIKSVEINSTPATLTDNSFNATISLKEGRNAITIKAIDKAGNETTTTLNIICDTKAPVIQIISPNVATVNTGTISVSGTVSDENISTVTVNSKNVYINPTNGHFDTTVQLQKGQNSITIIAIDKAGNRNSQIVTVYYKTQTVIVLQIGQTTFTVNSSPNTLDSPPIIKNGRTLLPIRPIVEALGGSVSWDGTERKVTVSLGSTTIELWIGKNTARVNGTDTPIDSTNSKVVPEIINGRTMLPLRFVTENLGCQLQWDPNTQTITITYQG